jgi:DNA (cytosine-5)-methyltransferase 1
MQNETGGPDVLALSSIELCAGVGMLGEGVRAALQYLGIKHRTVCYVEREAAAAGQLVTLMEAGALDPAPVWSDLLTFDSAAWRDCVDLVIAGFPCQDLSIAGRRAGLNDGTRSGLFFRVLDIADACGAWGLVLENVAGIATATASAVDEAEGELEERAAARVVGELADRGWNAEWLTLSASDVGASHGRARWFCLAWRRDMDDAGRVQRRARHEQDRPSGAEEGQHEADDWFANGSGLLADAGSTGQQGCELGGACADNRGRAETHGPTGQLRGVLPFFAPGPSDPNWAGIIAGRPDLAPATEPGVRMLVDGLDLLVDESRTHQLRQVGNGVVPLCAAAAIVVLFQRAKHVIQ